jgi:hypothetical protein
MAAFVPKYRPIKGIPTHDDPRLAGLGYKRDAFMDIPAQILLPAAKRRNSLAFGPSAKHGLWRCSSNFGNLAARVTVFLKILNDKDSARQLLENCLDARYTNRNSDDPHKFAYGYVEKAMNEVAGIPPGEAQKYELRWQPGGFVLSRTSTSSLADLVQRAQAAPEPEPEPVAEVDPTYEEWKDNKIRVKAGAPELSFANDETLSEYKKRYAEEQSNMGKQIGKKGKADARFSIDDLGGRRRTRRKNGRRRTQKKRKTYV